MASRHEQNVIQIMRVAEALKHLREKVVFIGGSVVGLLLTDKAAPDVRPTKDVDVIVEVTGLSDHAAKEADLRDLGFKHDISETGHMLRFLLDELIVDILPEDGKPFGMKTDWYKSAVRSAQIHRLPNALNIKVISAPLLICTKFHAFSDRGNDNIKESKDIEDILAVIDGRPELIDEVKIAEPEARQFISKEFAKWIERVDFAESLSWQLIEDQQEREDIIIERIKRIIELKEV